MPSSTPPSSSAARSLTGCREQDFAFTVEAVGVKYDVYHFRVDGSRVSPVAKAKHGDPATLAFARIGEQWVIAILKLGHLGADEARAAIEAGAEKAKGAKPDPGGAP